MTDHPIPQTAFTNTMLRVARLAVRFGNRPGTAGTLGQKAHEMLVRHRNWERRFVADGLKAWRETGAISAIRALRRGLNIQMTDAELAHILDALERRRPCAMLVFGMGNDSILWFEANRGGDTVFLEDDPYWNRIIHERHPSLQSVPVVYGTRAADWRRDLADPTALILPQRLTAHPWDLILVDGPAAYTRDSPGRVQSVLAARRLVAPQGAIMVHDCNREAERGICDTILGHLPMASRVGSLRHYSRPAAQKAAPAPRRPPAAAGPVRQPLPAAARVAGQTA